MQVHKFESGGFVVHKLTVPYSKMKFSVWYDARGKVLDAEAFDSLNRPRAIRKTVYERLHVEFDCVKAAAV